MEAPVSADLRAAFQRGKSDSGRFAVSAGLEGREDGDSTPREEEGEWEGLEEIEFWPEEGEGQGICGEGWARATLECIFPLFLSFVLFSFVHFLAAAFGGKETGMPH